MKNLKRGFHFNQNKTFKKVQILINYLLVTSWIIVPKIITIDQLKKLRQAIQILKVIKLPLKAINLKKNLKNHLKIIASFLNLWIKKNKVKKVKKVVNPVIKLKEINKVKSFKSNNKVGQKVKLSFLNKRKSTRKYR